MTCSNCGAELGGARFCAKCGTPAPAGAAPPPGASYQQPPPQAQAGAGLPENVASALCYALGLITGILFLVMAPYNTNPRIKFHAFQSIFFHVGWIVFWIGMLFVGMMLPWSLHLILWPIRLLIGFGGFLLWLFLMYKAYNGEKFVLPIVGPIAEQQAGRQV
jgi:uncharacterized membrane protein